MGGQRIQERVSAREMAELSMGGRKNWKLPPGREAASSTMNPGSHLQRHLPEKGAAKALVPHRQKSMMDLDRRARGDCPSPSRIPRPQAWRGQS